MRLCLLPLDRIDKGLESLINYISAHSVLKDDFKQSWKAAELPQQIAANCRQF